MITRLKTLGLASALALLSGLSAAEAETTIITDATVHTMGEAGTLEGADVVITDGKITAVGVDLATPDGADVIDGSGKVVTPGFMTSMSQLGLVEVNAVRETREGNAGDDAETTAAADVTYGINPASTLIPVTRIEGVTRAVVAPGGSKTYFSGQGAVIALGNGPDLVVKAKAAQFADMTRSAAGMSAGTRFQAWPLFESALAEAETLTKQGGWFTPKPSPSHPVLSGADLQALAPVASGDVALIVQVNRVADIRRMLNLSKEYGLKLGLLQAAEAWQVADEIADAGATVIVRVADNLPGRFETLTARLDNAARLEHAGVKVAFSQFDTHNERLIPQSAGIAVANGMSHEGALKGLTVHAAELYGIADSYGTLEAGKDADVVVWDGDPLEVTSAPVAIFIQGEAIELTSRQTTLRDRYKDLERKELPFQYR